MNILLISPRTPDTFWSFAHALPFVVKRASMPPLGLLTVASMLPRRWNYRLVDLNVRRLRDRDLEWADYALVSAMLIHKASVENVGRRARALQTPVIGGGPLFCEDDDPIAGIDHVVLGEAEELASTLAADMAARRVRPLYRAERFPDLSSTPIPRWDLLNLRDYATMTVQSCRGCPFDCEFCDIVALNGRRPRYKGPRQFIAELETLRCLGWQGATFLVDDNFIGNRSACVELLRAIVGWRRETGARMTFLTEASVNMAADRELLELMVAAGFKRVFLGIETPDVESLKECHKLHNTRGDLVAVVHTIQRSGIEVMGGFIIGFDNDGPDIFERQFQFIQKAGVVTAMVGLLQAVPRSRLYHRLAREGRLLSRSLGENTRAALNFQTKLDSEYIIENYRALIQRLYAPPAYYERVRAFLKQHQLRGPREPVTWRGVAALLRSLWVLGVAHRGRRAYWHLLASTLMRRPAHFSLAVTLAIYGHHFRMVAKQL